MEVSSLSATSPPVSKFIYLRRKRFCQQSSSHSFQLDMRTYRNTWVKLELLQKDPLKHYNVGGVSFAKLQGHLHNKPQLGDTVWVCSAPLLRRTPGFCRPSLHVYHKQSLNYTSGMHVAPLVCAAALNARCGAEQTQTVEKPVSVISNAPVHSKEKSPQLDDGGTGFPPRDDDGDGGGGGGGGGNWSGGFFFFGFLAFLGFLKDKESEGPYQDHRQD